LDDVAGNIGQALPLLQIQVELMPGEAVAALTSEPLLPC